MIDHRSPSEPSPRHVRRGRRQPAGQAIAGAAPGWRRRQALARLGAAGISLAASGSLTACALPGTGGGAVAPIPVPPAPSPTPPTFPPVDLPADEAPHGSLTEWWYVTGHLYHGSGEAAAAGEYGFELVFFRTIRGDRPPGYAAHFAVTDLPRSQFRYDQRADVAVGEAARPAVQASPTAERPPGVVALIPPQGGFDLALGDWRLHGGRGRYQLAASMPAYQLELSLVARRPAALHLGDPPVFPGLITLGPAGYTYYYSYTRLDLSGTLVVDGQALAVGGEAWMDHQWGDFLVLGDGGWDWFAGQLHDGRDVVLSAIRDGQGTTNLFHATLVTPGGEVRHVPPADLRLDATGTWTSPHTGIRYPSGWRVQLPGDGLDLVWTPLLQDQELDTRPTTGVVYWEGAVRLADAAGGADVGRGYVELTGYTPAG